MRSKTDEALDEMQISFKDVGELLQDIRAQQDSLSQQLHAASQGRRALWVAVVLLAFLLGALHYRQLAMETPPASAAADVSSPAEDEARASSPPPAEAPAAEPPEPQPEDTAAEAPLLPQEPPAAASASPAEVSEPSRSRASLAQPIADPEDPVATDSKGSILVSGASAWLVGPEGQVSPGAHEAGSYEVFVDMGGTMPLSLGAVQLSAGDAIQFNCGFGTCKRIQ
jgi:hypothetical protein